MNAAPEYICDCAGCGAKLFTGMKGHICEDGDPYFCAACAYSWEQVKEQREELVGKGDLEPQSLIDFMADYASHIAAGGSADDPMLHDL